MTALPFSELSANDLRGVLDFVDRIAAVESPSEFTREAATALSDLVPCDFVTYNVMDLLHHTAHVSTEPDGVLFDGADDALGRNLDGHPIVAYFAAASPPSARRLSEFVSQRELHRLPLYGELLRLVSNEYILGVPPLLLPGPSMVAFGLHRQSSDFTTREQAIIDAATPRITSALTAVRTSVMARALALALEHGEVAVAVLDESGRIAHVTSAASELLQRHLGSLCTPGGTLPLSFSRTGVPRRSGRGSLGALAWQWTREEDHFLVLFSERQDSAVRLRFGISDREEEVLALVADGRTNAEIAERLYISVRTVKKHMESIFRKLDVRTRAAATASYLRTQRT